MSDSNPLVAFGTCLQAWSLCCDAIIRYFDRRAHGSPNPVQIASSWPTIYSDHSVGHHTSLYQEIVGQHKAKRELDVIYCLS